MIRIRPADTRGRAPIDWLEGYHSFSFGDFVDPEFMRYRDLQVLNDDTIAPKAGFAMHPHRDMEIITYVVEGALKHEDSLGHRGVIEAGDVQRMTAGTGIRHSEFNASDNEPVRLLQIWIAPVETGLAPGYEQRHFAREARRGRLLAVATRDGRGRSLLIHQDVDLFAAILAPNEQVSHPLAPGRHAWVQVVDGQIEINSQALARGDGAALDDEREVTVTARKTSEFLLFDLR